MTALCIQNKNMLYKKILIILIIFLFMSGFPCIFYIEAADEDSPPSPGWQEFFDSLSKKQQEEFQNIFGDFGDGFDPENITIGSGASGPSGDFTLTTGCAENADACSVYCEDPCRKENGTLTGKNEPEGITCLCPFTKYKKIEQVIEAVMDWIFYFALVIAPLIIILGAFLFMTSAGDPAKTTKAKSMIIWAAVGLGVILFSKVIYSIIINILTGN